MIGTIFTIVRILIELFKLIKEHGSPAKVAKAEEPVSSKVEPTEAPKPSWGQIVEAPKPTSVKIAPVPKKYYSESGQEVVSYVPDLPEGETLEEKIQRIARGE